MVLTKTHVNTWTHGIDNTNGIDLGSQCRIGAQKSPESRSFALLCSNSNFQNNFNPNEPKTQR